MPPQPAASAGWALQGGATVKQLSEGSAAAQGMRANLATVHHHLLHAQQQPSASPPPQAPRAAPEKQPAAQWRHITNLGEPPNPLSGKYPNQALAPAAARPAPAAAGAAPAAAEAPEPAQARRPRIAPRGVPPGLALLRFAHPARRARVRSPYQRTARPRPAQTAGRGTWRWQRRAVAEATLASGRAPTRRRRRRPSRTR